jgi:hypothetical protein
MWTAENRDRYNRDYLRYPSDLTDEEPSVPMMMRHLPPGNLDLRARKDYLSHAHAPETDRCSGR